MTAKEYLGQAYRLNQRISSKCEALRDLDLLAKKDTAVMTGMPGSPNRGKQTMADTVIRIVDLQREIHEDINRLVDLKANMYHAFQKVGNVDYQLILEKRYLCNKAWPEIAVDLDIGMRQLYYLRDKALAEVEPYLFA